MKIGIAYQVNLVIKLKKVQSIIDNVRSTQTKITFIMNNEKCRKKNTIKKVKN